MAFALQWRRGLADPTTRWAPPGSDKLLPGMDPSPLSFATGAAHSSSSFDCLKLARSSSPSFPYFHDWKFDLGSNLKPKICIATTTLTGFHTTRLAVSTIFLFVEGKAASPQVSKVLESFFAFITALTATEEAMMNWYHEHVVWGDKDLKMKLLRKGNSHIRSHDHNTRFTRFQQLYLRHCSASAPATLSKQMCLSTVDRSNTS